MFIATVVKVITNLRSYEHMN